MMDFWTYDNFAAVTTGRWLVPPDDPAATVAGITQDTRTLTPGQAYLAVVGDNFDGHRFLEQAFAAGASLAIVEREIDAAEFDPPTGSPATQPTDLPPRLRQLGPMLLVDDTVSALQQLAHAYRDLLAAAGCTVISVSGSNGKTTTRHLIHHVLTSCGLTGTQSPKSFNNHLGVPLTLLAADPGSRTPAHNFVACEVGTNHPGEIDALARIVRPDLAVITSIGHEHLEFFHDLEGVAEEEAAVLPHVGPGGLVIIPAAAGELLAPHYDVQDEVTLLSITDDAGVPAPGDLPLAGMHNRMNAALALATARHLGIATTQAADTLQTFNPPPGRMQVIRLGQGVTIIHDAYNANPDSMKAAIDHLSMVVGRKVAILGDMLELGGRAKPEHQALGRYVHQAAIDFAICIGRETGDWTFGFLLHAPVSPPSEYPAMRFSDVDAAICTPSFNRAGFLEQLAPGDTILLKASRGMRLERLIPAIEARFPPEAPERDKSRR